MRFLFVDQIRSMNGNKITGTKFFKADEPLRHVQPSGLVEVAPGVISEAIGQLVSWLAIAKNDFVARPVFLFADKIEILAPVRPGSLVELEATIHSIDGQTLVFSGEASVDGQVVHRVHNVSGYMIPLGQLEDPHLTRTRMNDLTTRGLLLDGHGDTPYAFSDLIDSIVELNPGEAVTAEKTMRANEAFYRDHFPRNPVTPIVMINEMIGQATARMFGPSDQRVLRPVSVSGIKIKNFVRPGETCAVRVRLKERTVSQGKEQLVTVAEIAKDGKRILRGQYAYQLEEARS